MNTSKLVRAKSDLRTKLLAARVYRCEQDSEGVQRRLLADSWRNALLDFVIETVPINGTVCAFLPTATEPPIRPALRSIYESGRTILAPISRPGRVLDWTRWTPDTRVEISRFGIQEPVGPRLGAEAFVQAELRLVPALAIDARGVRLGYGGGFYDTALEAAAHGPHIAADIGICFADEFLEAGRVPSESHDARLPQVCTDEGFTRIRQSP
ncbi:5-formyltetrahydrofolate cyclo-ligase [Kocuria sp. TGY1127_2]|uniref:5-formyltetrahydrofolate cyclo-ligase n=1 Tax=Kocuria sp. TGY1127_2 TaxID=2711328 RepID=UPI0015BA41B6|nr:5-formyltetrahydrofolate cyclo-ligase [Kocuria sp. TGY1127_2]